MPQRCFCRSINEIVALDYISCDGAVVALTCSCRYLYLHRYLYFYIHRLLIERGAYYRLVGIILRLLARHPKVQSRG